MIIQVILINCAIILILVTASKCNTIDYKRLRRVVENRDSSSITGSASAISETKHESATFVITDDDGDNTSNSHKEFPSSELYQEENDDYYISPANGDDELPECILSRSEYYLNWWVHENGSLKIPASNRLDGVGFIDLSLEIHTEDSIHSYVLSLQSLNVSEVGHVACMKNNNRRMLVNFPLAGDCIHDTGQQSIEQNT